MQCCKFLCGSLLVACVVVSNGCVHAPRDTTGFALNDEIVVQASFNDTWQTVKDILRENELDLYTRDKRGRFVAYTPERRRYFQPNRYQYTFTLEAISESQTRVALDTRKQTYGVTLLTYPGWHDRKTVEAPESQALLDAIQARIAGPPASQSLQGQPS